MKGEDRRGEETRREERRGEERRGEKGFKMNQKCSNIYGFGMA